MRRTAAALAAMLMLAGCRTPPPGAPPAPVGRVEGGVLVEGDDGARYPQLDGLRYEAPVEYTRNRNPAYPPALLAQRLPPVAVRVRIVVEPDGHVSRVAPLQPAPQAFLDAVDAAVRAWRFTPLERHAAGAPEDDPGEALPFRLDYEFVFRQDDGRPTVTR